MPRRKVGFLGLELDDGVEERMKTPTPTRTWGGILLVFSYFFCCAGSLVVCLFWEMVVVVIFSCIWDQEVG